MRKRIRKKHNSYEATKIELLPGQSENPVGFSRNDNNSISGAKLLQGVEKSYEPGKKLLDESENIQESEQDEGLDAAETDEKLSREGDGTYTDGELSLINDPVAKWLGKNQRTKAQQKSFAERQRERMADHAKSLAERLHLDNVEIITDASMLDGKKQRAKGFYSKSTGKITIVTPNHASMRDVEQTLLHEAVAHHGLRQLFGEHFDTFHDNVFNNAENGIRERIIAQAAKRGWDIRTIVQNSLYQIRLIIAPLPI